MVTTVLMFVVGPVGRNTCPLYKVYSHFLVRHYGTVREADVRGEELAVVVLITDPPHGDSVRSQAERETLV
ncbi:uncharacterized protein ACLA_023630 [Aspergillus clavatus NRRL 1]|uniref:Uncharacterized protein n=1 Tax=Aspergillus clavatus (strain ATCC 1007 / CBS 513.65 / DSM 816 / NCTC 3887 / NRRL 1 / QM 1276 / 107) TaxID=344612 RepID=A1CPS8_ASPCL|nr:uncharacterized protein ACLA_023630 [Aspergillus clavatus NRRL 1]EAW07649.1 hypothetical protein ACLA_023630 [Aspergillus clavatus NRRL 1]